MVIKLLLKELQMDQLLFKADQARLFLCRTKFAVKESQSLPRIPDTLVYAMEFITMAVPPEQSQALEALRKEILYNHPDLKVLHSPMN